MKYLYCFMAVRTVYNKPGECSRGNARAVKRNGYRAPAALSSCATFVEWQSLSNTGAGLKRRVLSVSGTVLMLIPVGDTYTSLTRTKACPHRGCSHALDADMGASRLRMDLVARELPNAGLSSGHIAPSSVVFLRKIRYHLYRKDGSDRLSAMQAHHSMVFRATSSAQAHG